MRRYQETPERIFVGNPECVAAPTKEQLEGYEGMSVQLCPASKPWPQDYKFRNALDVWDFAKIIGMIDDVRERFYAIYTNAGNVPLGYRLIGAGGAIGVLVDPKILFQPAIILAAVNIFCVHNHPSGRLEASPTDRALVKRLERGASMLGLKIRENLVASSTGYYSFVDEGLLGAEFPEEGIT